MTELLVHTQVIKPYETLIDLGADAFVIGEQKFGLRLTGNTIDEQMTEAVALASQKQ